MKIGTRTKVFTRNGIKDAYVKSITDDKKFAVVQIIGGLEQVIRIGED